MKKGQKFDFYINNENIEFIKEQAKLSKTSKSKVMNNIISFFCENILNLEIIKEMLEANENEYIAKRIGQIERRLSELENKCKN